MNVGAVPQPEQHWKFLGQIVVLWPTRRDEIVLGHSNDHVECFDPRRNRLDQDDSLLSGENRPIPWRPSFLAGYRVKQSHEIVHSARLAG